MFTEYFFLTTFVNESRRIQVREALIDHLNSTPSNPLTHQHTDSHYVDTPKNANTLLDGNR